VAVDDTADGAPCDFRLRRANLTRVGEAGSRCSGWPPGRISPRGCRAGELLGQYSRKSRLFITLLTSGMSDAARLGSRGAGYRSKVIDRPKEGTVLITILVILVIIAVALFIWRNMAGRRV
jgi:hypothetical protein